ncbi:ArsR/SmtB family transcription factor [Ureibacillus sp. MALMAid1270]|uniref:ArsR/SmtB family transcription factor n=1 Tax=Ureibacillus sp. MALMAid1270 TaxID=3411629 RepID=UPI003BA763E2
MGSEMDIFEQPLEQVMYVSSPVVESIAMLCAMTTNNKEFLEEDLDRMYEEIGDLPIVDQLRRLPENSVYLIFNLLIPIPNFASVDHFSEKVKQLKDEYFVFYWWSEDIPLETIQQLIHNPASIWDIEETYYWQQHEDRAYVEEWLLNLSNFKEQFADILLRIAQSKTFQELMESKQSVVQQSIATLKQLSLEPLLLAQYVMGKTFRRVSDYKMYYFLPSYFISPVRIRIFNDSVCYVVYGCAKQLSDDREKSETLSKQLKAIADPNRLLILRMLATHKEYGAKLAEYLGITTATVSHHIETLKKVGLVKEEKIGTIKYFTADKEQVNKMFRTLQTFMKA